MITCINSNNRTTLPPTYTPVTYSTGAGESLRGNINSFVDNVGEQIAGRGDTAHGTSQKPATVTEGGQRPAETAQQGAGEVNQGLAELRK
jgi:hypothetical protein